ncbi:CPBP family glutamic-type intramembrane protease [Brachybacterium sp. AOP25-B2-12]|uniref:CPBP family glutamic-type intramembrane protease n=1 Tax=Brachybacterium sp. AOP25-B2-12 TaxID=3457710 RepID=UPI0040343208
MNTPTGPGASTPEHAQGAWTAPSAPQFGGTGHDPVPRTGDGGEPRPDGTGGATSPPAAEHGGPRTDGSAPGTGVPTAPPAIDTPAPRRIPAPILWYEKVPWRRVGLFTLISYAIFAVIAAPFWFLAEGIAHPLFVLVIGMGMWAPAIASIIMSKAVEKTSWRTRVGLRFRGRWLRILAWSGVGIVAVLAVQLLSAIAMVLRGVPGDLTGRTWLEIGTLQFAETAGTEVSPVVFVAVILFVTVAGIVVTTAFTLGEEIGWRGWLWTALKPLGPVRAAIVGGAIWSLWHLPVMIIGYNYAGIDRWIAIPFFILPCIGMSLLFGAITDRAAGSPIPAAIAHSVFNVAGTTVLGLVATEATVGEMSLLIDTHAGIIAVVLLLGIGALLTPWRSRPSLPVVTLGRVVSPGGTDAATVGPHGPHAPDGSDAATVLNGPGTAGAGE